VAAESVLIDSMLILYREALRIRRSAPALGDGPMAWQPSPDGVLAFDRTIDPSLDRTVDRTTEGEGTNVLRCVANLSAVSVALPPHAAVLLASGPLDGGLLPPDTTVWLRLGR
jgi:alpha-glucosidase